MTTIDDVTGSLSQEQRWLLEELMMRTPYCRNYAQHVVQRICDDPGGSKQFPNCSVSQLEEYVDAHYSEWTRQRSDDPMPIDLFLWNHDYEEPDWLIEGVCEIGSRTIVTAPKGAGKSTLLDQIGIQCASGIHPFTGEPMKPLRVLLLDCENDAKELGLRMGELSRIAGDRLVRGNINIECTDSIALDLSNSDNFEWLTDVVCRLKIDLVLAGPLYKMCGLGNPKDEHVARALSDNFDELRTHCAIIIEAHSTKDQKSIAPFGAGLWERWPDYGYNLSENGQIRQFRNPRKRGQWPSKLHRGGEWPWSASAPETSDESSEDVRTIVLEYLNAHPGEVTRRGLPKLLRAEKHRIRDTAAMEALEELAAAGTIRSRTQGNRIYFSGGAS
jgi:hypothetical protein